MAEQDWIEQDEFDRRRSLFGAKCAADAAARPQPSVAAARLPAKRPSEAAPTKPQEPQSDVSVTVIGMAGDTLWGPGVVTAGTRVHAFLDALGEALRKPGGSMRLLHGDVCLGLADVLAAKGNVEPSLQLTLVYLDPPPEGAIVLGELAVWEKPEADASSDGAAVRMPPRRPPNQTQVLLGRSGRTGEIFLHKASFGRCNYATLRFGRTGLYYNSSSHGTATFALQTYAEATAAGDNADDEMYDEMRAIIPGPHCHGSKDRAALGEARRFAESLFVAAGRTPPRVVPSVLSRWRPSGGDAGGAAAANVKAWLGLLDDLGITYPILTIWALVYMPWLDGLGSMNETDLWTWEQQGYPDLLSDMPEDSQERIRRGIEEHY